MRQDLLSTAPKELTERPKPKNTATSVLPPRHPNAERRTPTQIETKAHDLTKKAEAQPSAPVPVVEAISPSTVREEKPAAAPKTVSVPSKSTLVFGSLEQIQLSRQKRTAPAKTATTAQEEKPKAEPRPVPATQPPVVAVVSPSTVEEEKPAVAPKAVTVPSKSTLVFGNLEQIQLSRQRHAQKKAQVTAAMSPQEGKSKTEPRPAPVTKAPVVAVASPSSIVREEKPEIPTKAAPVQSKSTLVFGDLEQIQLSRQKRKAPAKTVTITQEGEPTAPPVSASPVVEHKAKPVVVTKTVPPSAPFTPALVFGNPQHIQLSRQRRPKSKASNKPAEKKQIVYVEFPACSGCAEDMPLNQSQAVPRRQQTLWELIESSSQVA